MTRLSCLLLMCAAQVVAADKKESGPMEIDFSPLAKTAAKRYTVVIVVTSEDGHKTEVPCEAKGSPPPLQVARTVQDSLPTGWDVSRDESKLVIKSYKGSPVKSITVEMKGEDVTLAPTVKRLKPEGKKEDIKDKK